VDAQGLERAAAALLPPDVADYFAGGAGEEGALAANRAAWRAVELAPRVLAGVGTASTATSVLGTPVAAPVLVAPFAYHALAHPEGELATRRGAARAGTVAIVPTQASRSIEEVAAASDGPWWFQLYAFEDRAFTADLVDRAAAAGAGAIVLTVDAPGLGDRRRDVANGFLPTRRVPLANVTPEALARAGGDAERLVRRHERGLTPDAIDLVAQRSGLPVVVKGVLRPVDARTCVDAGAAAIVVSNHGGRQLDRALATARALGPVAEAVGERAEVYVDGGVRDGEDVLIALALGARAVLVARPVVWALATGGEDGVAALLTDLAEDLERALRLAGCADARAVPADLIAR
jgi:4-hydroxymandelate oxidase